MHPILTLMMMKVMTFLFPRLLILQCIHVKIKVTHVVNKRQQHQLRLQPPQQLPRQLPQQPLLLPRRLLRHVIKEMVTNALIFK